METDVQTSSKDRLPAPRDVRLWFPDIPDPSLTFVSVPDVRGRSHRHLEAPEMPLSMILFGGPKGELLDHIAKMTVWIQDDNPKDCKILGIAFTFDCLVEGGQNLLMLGRRGRDGGHSFFIDGCGERICRVERISQYSLTFDLGFKVSLKLHLNVYLGLYVFDCGFANSVLFCKRSTRLETDPSNSHRPTLGCLFGKTPLSNPSM